MMMNILLTMKVTQDGMMKWKIFFGRIITLDS